VRSEINSDKCKYLHHYSVNVSGSPVNQENNFVFFGSVVPNTLDDVKRKIGLASSVFGCLKKMFGTRKIYPKS